ncbi:MAG: zinc ribbon domain-containing protein [Candidatus Omnitrophica bacterium]|nr:zinc ribbon domain-containing protein [Candidatus Omnitrophota bacterium]
MEGGSGTGAKKTKYYYYICKNDKCKFRISAAEIEGFIIQYIKSLSNDKDVLAEIIKTTNKNIQTELPQLISQKDNMRHELAQVQKFAQGILDQWTQLATDENSLFLKDKLNELGVRRKEIEQGICNLEVMIEEIREEAVSQEMLELMLTKFDEIFDTIKPYQKKELINCILHKAILTEADIKIALYGKQTDTRLFNLLESQDDISRPVMSDWLPGLDSNQRRGG